MPTPRLRAITDDDVPTVLDLNHRHVALLSPMDAPRLRQLQGWADRADVIDLGEEVAGFVVTFAPGSDYDSENYRWFSQRYEDFTYLDRVVVDVRFRRQGLARLVYDELEAAAGSRMLLEVNVDPPNEPSLAFHRGRGYVEVGRAGDPGHVVALMAKDLEAAPTLEG
ncbi:MAG: GNAT family N-acetyltransferase [Actinomycetota bacterium]|nr:GNAT family N-acetyltransferase [Actinomycetota bacterium]